MSNKTIYLIRHGETEYNRKGIVQGSGIDSVLNEKGHSQAQAFFDAYKHIVFEKVYTSQLQRTHQSVNGFLEKGLKHEILPGLNEISWGVKEGKVPSDSEKAYYESIMKRWANGETNLAIEGGESPEEVIIRQKQALSIILKNQSEKLILVAMHGRALRIILSHITETPLKDMDNFKHGNLCLYKLSYSYLTNKYTVLSKNDTSHLAKMVM